MDTSYCPQCGGHSTPVQAFACSMAQVGVGVEARYERACVEYVFGLTGGELEEEPLKFKDEDEDDRSWRYHYEGYPEWAYEDFGSRRYEHDPSQYLTLIETGVSYSSGAPEELHFPDGEVWFKVRDYTHSGETECPMGSCGDDETVGKDSTEGMARCPLCEADAGEKHGHIYVGGSVETVYRHIDIACAVCEVPASEIKSGDACQCVYARCKCGWEGLAEVIGDKLYCAAEACDEQVMEID
jgi:hypothetical protein